MSKLRSHMRKLGTYNFKIYIYIFLLYLLYHHEHTHKYKSRFHYVCSYCYGGDLPESCPHRF